MRNRPDPCSRGHSAQNPSARPAHQPIRRVLFLCTGNFYRSRFAEELFNHLAAKGSLRWRAESRALALERGIENVGPISTHAVRELTRRNVPIPGDPRMPLQAVEADFEDADVLVALCEREHRPLVRERFPAWEERVEYWQVEDVGTTHPGVGLAAVEEYILQLLARLNPL